MSSLADKSCSVIILAAGNSERMGTPKALLKIDGLCFLESIITKVEQAGIKDIVIVLGKDSSYIQKYIEFSEHLKVIQNKKPEEGPLSSIRLALNNIDTDTKGFILVLVDHPLVNGTTYKMLVARAHPQKIVIPVYNKKNGHPVFFGSNFFNDLRHVPLDEGARYVVHKYPEHIIKVEVDDKGILRDIDLPEDYEKYISESGI